MDDCHVALLALRRFCERLDRTKSATDLASADESDVFFNLVPSVAEVGRLPGAPRPETILIKLFRKVLKSCYELLVRSPLAENAEACHLLCELLKCNAIICQFSQKWHFIGLSTLNRIIDLLLFGGGYRLYNVVNTPTLGQHGIYLFDMR